MDILIGVIIGILFVLVLSPLIENTMGVVYSLFELIQLKFSVIKVKLQNQITSLQSEDNGMKKIIGFADKEEEYDD